MLKDAQTPGRPFRSPRATTLVPLVPWVIAALAVCGLYFGKSVLIPITLAGLLAFLLAPVASLLRRLGLPRLLAIFLAVAVALSGLAATSAVLVSQASTLSKDAPAYAERITEKSQRVSREIRRRFDFILRESAS